MLMVRSADLDLFGNSVTSCSLGRLYADLNTRQINKFTHQRHY